MNQDIVNDIDGKALAHANFNRLLYKPETQPVPKGSYSVIGLGQLPIDGALLFECVTHYVSYEDYIFFKSMYTI